MTITSGSATKTTIGTRHQRPSTARTVAEVFRAPGIHWVGDGFRVMGHLAPGRGLAEKLSPFLLLDYHPPFDYPPTDSLRRGVGVHPHRGFETVTLAFEGSVAHHDSAGGGGVIGPGDVQWMTAARGVLHREYHEASYARRGGPFHMVQLWVNLPRAHKMGPPRYQALTAAEIGLVRLPDGAGEARVIAGELHGVKGPASTMSPVTLLDLRLRAGRRVEIPIPSSETAALLVMKGALEIGGDVVTANELALLDRAGDRVALEAREEAHVLLLGGEPIDEPIVQYGPFVMNTEREIVDAITDFGNGAFGRLED